MSGSGVGELPAGGAHGRSRRWWLVLLLLAACAVALTVRVACTRDGMFCDEAYHILAARTWRTTGELAYAPGRPYPRAALFTMTVAGVQSSLGDSLDAARLPALVFGVGLVLVLLLWVYREAGLTAAALAAGLQALSAPAIYYSTLCRFYAPQYLCVVLLAWSAAALVRPGQTMKGQAAALATAIAAFGVGTHLQISTVIPAGVIAAWAGGVLLYRALHSDAARVRAWVVRLSPLLILALLGTLVTSWQLHLVEHLVKAAHFHPTWAEHEAGNTLYYWHDFARWYGWMWLALPTAAALAAARPGRDALTAAAWLAVLATPTLLQLAARALPAVDEPVLQLLAFAGHAALAGLILRRAGLAPRAPVVLLWLAVIVVTMAVHSALAAKAGRYVQYSAPLLFATWAVAAAALLEMLARRAAALATRRAWPSFGRVTLAAVVVLAAAAPLALRTRQSYAFLLTQRLLADPNTSRSPFYDPDWRPVLAQLRGHLDAADAVLVSSPMKGLYYLPQRETILLQVKPNYDETQADTDGGRYIAATPELLARLIDERPRGVALIERPVWGRDAYVSLDLAKVLTERTRAVDLPAATGMMAFEWGFDHDADHGVALQPSDATDPTR